MSGSPERATAYHESLKAFGSRPPAEPNHPGTSFAAVLGVVILVMIVGYVGIPIAFGALDAPKAGLNTVAPVATPILSAALATMRSATTAAAATSSPATPTPAPRTTTAPDQLDARFAAVVSVTATVIPSNTTVAVEGQSPTAYGQMRMLDAAALSKEWVLVINKDSELYNDHTRLQDKAWVAETMGVIAAFRQKQEAFIKTAATPYGFAMLDSDLQAFAAGARAEVDEFATALETNDLTHADIRVTHAKAALAYLQSAPADLAALNGPPSPTCENQFGDFCLVSTTTQSDGILRYVTGSVTNAGTRNYGYVQVEITLYDATNAVVGSTLANVNNLAPGATWKFKALMLQQEATRYKVASISGF